MFSKMMGTKLGWLENGIWELIAITVPTIVICQNITGLTRGLGYH